MSMKLPEFKYSQYRTVSQDPERCCSNCICYKVSDDKKGVCYEYEVLPKAGCKFFKPKK